MADVRFTITFRNIAGTQFEVISVSYPQTGGSTAGLMQSLVDAINAAAATSGDLLYSAVSASYSGTTISLTWTPDAVDQVLPPILCNVSTTAASHARLYTLLASAQRQGLNPQAYLTSVLAKIGQTKLSELGQFLPEVWKREDQAESPPIPPR